MQVTLKYFGQLRHFAEVEEEALDVSEGATLTEVVREVAARYGEGFADIVFDDAGAFRSSLMLLVNDVPVDKGAPGDLEGGETVTLLPAISGG